MNEISEKRKYFSRFGFVFLAGTLIVNGIQFLSIFVLYRFFPTQSENFNIAISVQLLPAYFIGYPLFALLIKKLLKKTEIEKNKILPGQFALAALIGFAILYMGNLLGNYISMLVSVITGTEMTNVVMQITDNSSLGIQIIIMVTLAPFLEELFFRKFLIDSIVEYGEWVAILTSGFMFGLIHGNITQFAYAMPIGMFFAFIYIRTGKIQYTIILHMIVNFVGGVLSTLIIKYTHALDIIQKMSGADYETLYSLVSENPVGVLVYMIYVFAVYAVMIAGIVVGLINKKKFFLNHRENEITKGQRLKAAVLNPGMIVFIVVWLAYFIVATFMQKNLAALISGVIQ